MVTDFSGTLILSNEFVVIDRLILANLWVAITLSFLSNFDFRPH